MKIDRLMGIMTLLLQDEQVTAPQLAERFEVSRRTISRDIEHLCQAGIPLVTTQGYGGGISIAEGYRLDRSLLTQEELQGLRAALRGLDSVSASPRLEGLLEKLSGGGGRVVAEDCIVIDLASFYQDSLADKIQTIKGAILGCRLLSFCYYAQKGEGVRRIEPYRLLFKWSSWYVLGYCLERRDFRLFKLNRLWELEEGQSFRPRPVPPDALEVGAFLKEEAYRLRAVFAPSERYRLIEEYGVDSFTEEEDGSLLLERDFAGYQMMRQWVLSFGDRARVLAPEALREDILEQAGRILATWRKEHDR